MRAKIQRFICLKRALVVSAFWTHDAEASASSDASASTYCRSEDVGILAVVMAKLELGKIKRQIFLAHVMVRAHDSAFEQAPERLIDVSLITWQTRLPLRAIAPITGVLPTVPPPLVLLRRWRFLFLPPM